MSRKRDIRAQRQQAPRNAQPVEDDQADAYWRDHWHWMGGHPDGIENESKGQAGAREPVGEFTWH